MAVERRGGRQAGRSPPLKSRQWNDLRSRRPSCRRRLVRARSSAWRNDSFAHDHRLPFPGKKLKQSRRYRRASNRWQHVLDDSASALVDPRHRQGSLSQRNWISRPVSPHAPRRDGDLPVKDTVLCQRIVLQPGRSRYPLCQRHAARPHPRLQSEFNADRSMRNGRVFHTLTRTSQRRRHHEVRPGGQRLLHRHDIHVMDTNGALIGRLRIPGHATKSGLGQ